MTVTAAVWAAIGGLSLATAANAAMTRFNLHIPREPLDAALRDLAHQTGVEVGHFSDQAQSGLLVGPVQGSLSPGDALRMLLHSTGLSYRALSDRAYIVATPSALASAAESVQSGAGAAGHQAGAANHSSNDSRVPAGKEGKSGSSERFRVAQMDQGTPAGASAVGRSQRAASPPPQLQEVIVTAQKREERLLDVPASVSSISAGALAAIGAVRMEDYLALSPGITLVQGAGSDGGNQISIRGITTGYGGSPTVGTYIDDAPFGGTNVYGTVIVPDLDPTDVARIEVLRGPQGTLYGAGSMGGLIKYVTAQPDPSHLFGHAEADASQVHGGGSGYGIRAAVNIPLSEKLALRIGGFDRQDPGYIKDVASRDSNVNAARYQGGRASIAWFISDQWRVTLSALGQHQSYDSDSGVDYNSFTFQPIYGALEHLRASGTGHDAQQLEAYSLHVEGDLGWAHLVSSSSYDSQRARFNDDFTPVLGPVIASVFGVDGAGASSLQFVDLKKVTQELRLNSPETNVISWQAGLFYTHEHETTPSSLLTFDATTGVPLTLGSISNISPDYHFEEAAVFGDVTYRLASNLDVTAGVRYSHNRQSNVETTSGALNGPTTTIDVSSADSSTTYLFTPRWHLSKDTMLYARIASGYRPGGPNLSVSGVPLTYGPDRVVNYELGMKSDFLDRTASIDLATYYIDWKGIQLFESNSEGFGYYGNAGAATSRGVELSAAWAPLPGLKLSGNGDLNLAKLATNLPPGGGIVGSNGDELPTTPRWSGQLSVDYEFPFMGDWDAHMGMSDRYIDAAAGQFASPGYPRFNQPTYDVFDVRAGVSRGAWSLMAYGKNLGNSHGESYANNLGNVTRVTIIQPRTFALSLSVEF